MRNTPKYLGPTIRICNGYLINTENPVDSEGASLQAGDLIVFNRSGTLCRGNIIKIYKKKKISKYCSSNLWYNVYVDLGNNQIAIVKNTNGIYRLRDYDH